MKPWKSVFLKSVLFLLTFAIFSSHLLSQELEGKLSAQSFEKQITKTIGNKYFLYLPMKYTETKQWPLLVFLHGGAQNGDNIELLKKHGLNTILENVGDLSFIIVAPQCPLRKTWSMQLETLNYFLDEIIDKYAVDTDRVYLTGFSMGGSGVWFWAVESPERFAAIVPISSGPLWYAIYPHRLKDIPVWAFHGAKDNFVPPSEHEEMINALKEIGGSPRFTVYSDVGHESWTPAYSTPELYTWLLRQKRKQGLEFKWVTDPSLKGNTTFRLKGYPNARVVVLAGSFNNWSEWSTIFGKEGDEWTCRIDLAPGKYSYKFIVDGEWITDPANPNTEGEGAYINSVLIVK